MSSHKHIDVICLAAALLALAAALVLLALGGPGTEAASEPKAIGYEDRLFDPSTVHAIDIVIDDWEGFLEQCENEEYVPCAVVIDGEAYKNVGLRAKGNTSLSQVRAMDSSRYSFKLEFDQYDSARSYHGLDKLCLNNLIQDNTMMKDYLAYRLMGSFGVDAPLCSYAFITVNGEDWGLYLAVEAVEDAFLGRNYGDDSGGLYKPDSMSMGGGRGNGRDFDMERFADRDGGEEPGQAPGWKGERLGEPPDGMPGGPGGMGSDDVKLQYIDDDPDSYPGIFDSAKTAVSEADERRLIASLKSLSAREDLESVLDMDEILRYFVVHDFVVNGDSYTGSMIHNYYLYERDGRLSMIPWDYNLAFGSFQSGSPASAVNDPIDDVLEDRPMQSWIFSDEAYTRRYHELFREFLDGADVETLIGETRALIAPYVERDPTKFCTYGEFETGVEALRMFCALRAESAAGQLDGSIPSTSAGQSAGGDALVDAAGLNISDMGTMGGGRGGGMEDVPAGGFGGGFDGPPAPPGGMDRDDMPMPPDRERDRMPPGGFSGDAGPESAATSLAGGGILCGGALVLLAAGLVFARRYKRRAGRAA